MAVIALPKILTEKLSDEGARALVEILNRLEADSHERAVQVSEDKFEKRLSEVRADIIKWMFIFWVGQVGTITAILFVFFK